MKKVFNIFSYLLNAFFISIFVIGFIKQASNLEDGVNEQQNKSEQIKQCIIEREKANLPLNIQGFKNVYDITINDFVFTNNKVEPYSGYMVTTWDFDEKQDLSTSEWIANNCEDKYIRKQKKVYIEVNNITIQKDEVSWYSNWQVAYMDAIRQF